MIRSAFERTLACTLLGLALALPLHAQQATASARADATRPAARQTRTLVAIVNRARPESGLSRETLIRIFRGDILRWPTDQVRIQFALPPGSLAARDEFIRDILKMTPTDYHREWRARRFRGESALIPNPDLSRTEVMQAVASQRHFIAIVELDWLRSIDARFTQDVKILSIDGLAPDDADYPLRLGLALDPMFNRFALPAVAPEH